MVYSFAAAMTACIFYSAFAIFLGSLLLLAMRRRSARKLLLAVIAIVLLFIVNVLNLVTTRSFDIAVLPAVFGCLVGLIIGSLVSLVVIGRIDRKLSATKIQ